MARGKYIRTPEIKRKNSEGSKGNTNRLGTHHTEESKEKIGMGQTGRYFSPECCSKRSLRMVGNTINWGKHWSEKTKEKMSLAKQNKYDGENNPNWKGGHQLTRSKDRARRRGLGKDVLNSPLDDSVGHHINNNYIVYIPKWLHGISHNVKTGRNMGCINILTLYWLYVTKEINNCKEIDYYGQVL